MYNANRHTTTRAQPDTHNNTCTRTHTPRDRTHTTVQLYLSRSRCCPCPIILPLEVLPRPYPTRTQTHTKGHVYHPQTHLTVPGLNDEIQARTHKHTRVCVCAHTHTTTHAHAYFLAQGAYEKRGVFSFERPAQPKTSSSAAPRRVANCFRKACRRTTS